MAGVKTVKKNIFKDKLVLTLIIVAVVVVICGAVILLTGGGITGKVSGGEVKAAEVSPLTGQIYASELPARPLVVSIDNVGDARPQSWISKADLVYEFPVEGKQTRLQAVYYGEFPEEFGRSEVQDRILWIWQGNTRAFFLLMAGVLKRRSTLCQV